MDKNRFLELAHKAYNSNTFTFTSFLGMSELDTFYSLQAELNKEGISDSEYTLYGGYEDAERLIIRFGNPDELGYEEAFPIACIHIRPLNAKFADKLTHRDFLGALMNLGIEREVLGDIICDEKEAFVFCHSRMAEYICNNLSYVKHTGIMCSPTDGIKELPRKEPKEAVIQASSLRTDAVIAKVYGFSRNESLECFRTGRVFVNGRLCESNSKLLKEEDCITVRGNGKFVIKSQIGISKKGKLNIKVSIY